VRGNLIVISDARTLRFLHYLVGHEGGVGALAFSSDGTMLASASGDETIRLWDVAGRKVLSVLRGHKNDVNAVAFSPDGTRLLSAGEDATVRLWDVKAGKEVEPPYRGHTASVNCVAWSPDGKHAVSAGGTRDGKGNGVDCDLHLWEVASRKDVCKLQGHLLPISRIAWSPDGKLVLSVSEDHTLRWWDPAAGRQVHRLVWDRLTDVTLSSDGKFAAVCTDGEVGLFAVHTKERLRLLPIGGRAAVFLPDNRHLLIANAPAGSTCTLRLWNIDSGEEERKPRPPFAGVDTVAFSPDGQSLLSCSLDAYGRLWSLKTGQHKDYPAYSNTGAVALSPTGRWVLVGDRELRLFDADTGEQLGDLRGHERPLVYMGFTGPDEALTADDSGTLRRWDAKSREGKVLRQLGAPLYGLVLSRDGRRALALVGATLRLWDLTGPKENVREIARGVGSMVFTPDGRKVYVGFSDGRLGIFDLESDNAPMKEPFFNKHHFEIRCLALSADGKTLVSADGGKVRVWDTTAGPEPVCGWTQPGGVNALAFHPTDNRLLATGNGNATIYLLRLPGPKK
jgi:WD40 repeat protein